MGCQQSTPSHVDPAFAKNAKIDGAVDATVLTQVEAKQLMSASTNSTKASSEKGSVSVNESLEVEEEMPDKIPKIDANGNLLAEEVVRRTSTSLQCTSVDIGCNKKGGKTFNMQVRNQKSSLLFWGMFFSPLVFS